MDKEITSILHSFGVYQHYHGYSYFLLAVKLAVDDPQRLQNIRRDIYIPISIAFETTFASAEKNIRTVRDVFIKNGGGKFLADITGNSYWLCNKPYPKELIELFAFYICNKDA